VPPEISGDLRTDATFQDIALKGTQRGEDKFEQAMVGNVFGIDTQAAGTGTTRAISIGGANAGTVSKRGNGPGPD